jgi:hypothetical protein
MLTVRPSDGAISVMPFLDTPVGTAIYEGDSYKRIGQITYGKRETKSPRTGYTRTEKGWNWWYDEEEYGRAGGFEPTKKAAVQAVLTAGGYVEAPPNVANQGLF